MVDASRRGFFRGRPRPKAEIRPPWALAESLFTDCCTRCKSAASAERVIAENVQEYEERIGGYEAALPEED